MFKKNIIIIILLMLSVFLVSCNMKYTTEEALNEFSKYENTNDVAIVVDDKKIYFGSHIVELEKLVEDKKEYLNGGYLITEDKIYFSTAKENYMYNFSFFIYECDLYGENIKGIYSQDKYRTNMKVLVNDMTFYLEYYTENTSVESSRKIDSYNILTKEYKEVASGKASILSDYNPKNTSDYQGKLVDKPYIGFLKDNSYYKITNTKTNEVKKVNNKYLKNSPYYELLKKYEYETKRIDISNNHILLTYRLNAGNGNNYSYLIFEYDFETETLEYKQLSFLDIDVLVKIIYIK